MPDGGGVGGGETLEQDYGYCAKYVYYTCYEELALSLVEQFFQKDGHSIRPLSGRLSEWTCYETRREYAGWR